MVKVLVVIDTYLIETREPNIGNQLRVLLVKMSGKFGLRWYSVLVLFLRAIETRK